MAVDEFTGVDALVPIEQQIPEPGPGEVVIEVAAASVDPADWKTASGRHARLKHVHDLPFVPGWGVAGRIRSAGADSRFQPGDRVFARMDIERQGGYAEYALLRDDEVAERPHGLAPRDAAAITVAGVTAWQSLVEHGRLTAGQRVLVIGGAGGVGHFAVQIAKALGAWVAATASGRNRRFLSEIGTDRPIDYETSSFLEALSGAPVDLVVDTVGGAITDSCLPVIRHGGRLISPAGYPDVDLFKAHQVDAKRMSTHPDPSALDSMAQMVMDGTLKPEIQGVFALDDAARAWRESMTGHVRGKLVLEIHEAEPPE